MCAGIPWDQFLDFIKVINLVNLYIWAYFKSTFLLLRDISLAFLVSSIGFSTYFDMKNDVYGPIDGRTLEKDRTEKSLTV